MKRINLSDQVVALIKERIRSGVYPPHALLPSIAELARELDVGRSTIREALSRLEMLEMVEIRHGKGVYVAEPRIDFSSRLKSFSETVSELGMQAGAIVLEKSLERADTSLAEKLNLQVGEPVNHLVRLRLAEGTPMAVETSYTPYAVFPGLLDCQNLESSLYSIFSKLYSKEVVFAIRTIEASLTHPKESKQLGLSGRQPALIIATVAFDHDRQPLEYGKSVYRADRYKFVVHQSRA